MKETLLAKYGEIALKGLNRNMFETSLLKTIRRRIQCAGDFNVYAAQSTVYIEPCSEEADIDEVELQLGRVFGLSAICRAMVVEKDIDAICAGAAEYVKEEMNKAVNFRVTTKRSDKKFPLTSMEVSRIVGGYLLSKYHNVKVTMDNPDVTVTVEVRDYMAYIHTGNKPAAGGLPTGTSGRAAVMLSGGIDSPVALYMMAKRGIDPVAVHFMSPPYTSERAHDKVMRLVGILSKYVGNVALLSVNFTEVQVAIRDRCPEEYFTVIMRRSMMRITNELCKREKCGAVVTGESLAQVASQTLSAIICTDEASILPVLRPLIGMDKNEIIAIAEKIDTMQTSIEPYEDCCTVFTPKHPKTQPKLEAVLEAELSADLSELEKKAATDYTVKMFHFFD